MLATQQAVSMHVGMQGNEFRKACDDTLFAGYSSECSTVLGNQYPSECSTVLSNQDIIAERDADNLSDCDSDAPLHADALIIFDWDDTLFPTSWILEQGLLAEGATVSAEQEAHLEKLADQVSSTLHIAMGLGKVVIITNAEQGWIEESCTKFTPSLASLLRAIDMVSARSSFGQYTKVASEWKRMAFAHEVDLFYGSGHAGQQRNILSVGDSLHEQRALKSVSKCAPHCSGKSIKLFDVPSIGQLMEQHELLAGCLQDMVEYDGPLDVEIGAETCCMNSRRSESLRASDYPLLSACWLRLAGCWDCSCCHGFNRLIELLSMAQDRIVA